MNQQLRSDCVGAIINAALLKLPSDPRWEKVLDLSLQDVVVQLEETGAKSAAAAVDMFAQWVSTLPQSASAEDATAYSNERHEYSESV
jgi:hypothetical protein